MAFLFYVYVFIFGLLIGSFLNVVCYRLPKGKSIVKGRSYCPKCRRPIKWFDNIPLLSFAFLKGQCRHCRKPIAWQYPIIELITGLGFLLNYWLIAENKDLLIFNFNNWLALGGSFVFTAFLLTIFIIDLRHYVILDKVVLPLAGLALLVNLLLGKSFINLVVAGIIGVSFFLIQYLISKGQWVGEGDIRLGLAMGLILGFPQILLALFAAYLSGSIVAILLVALKKKKFKSKIPFGPFLALGTYFIMLFGNWIINQYF